jgi:hypothetical protein
MLIALKPTELRNGNQTVLFEPGEKLKVSTMKGNTVTIPCKIDGHKQWNIVPEDWTVSNIDNDELYPETD